MNSIWQMAMAFPVAMMAAHGASADPSNPDLIFRRLTTFADTDEAGHAFQ